eukprot:TRINITY_DN113071_c0_g1_i1.p1 TRINITY_DN113071_c0_g1~~TRINITY_DN113071_c0_g1_i1.p1  ORF type:complete len:251 (+),score=34.61 TRINITY_DN113071_c0_g1_i1:84-836(+)
MDELVNATAGGVGAVVGSFVTYPLDVAKTRMQAAGVGSADARQSMRQMLARVLQEDGICGMLAMFPTTALQQGSSRFTYFYIYAFLMKRYRASAKVKRASPLVNLLLGYLAGIINTLFVCPLETIAIRVMAGKETTTLLAVTWDILKHSGPAGFYHGWTTTIYSSANPAITNTLFDQIRAVMIGRRASLSFAESWLLGAGSKAAATCITYPPCRVKSVMQNAGDAGDTCVDTSMPPMLSAIHSHDGFSGL